MSYYTPYPIASLGNGLNLKDKADAVDPADAIDLLNVVFTNTGAVAQRDGYNDFTDGTGLTNRATSLHPFYTTAGLTQLLAGCGTRLEAVDTAGLTVASQTGLTSGTWDFARVGTPNSEVAYAGQGTDTLQKWSGAAWTAPTGTVDGAPGAMPKAGSLAVVATSNRLAATRYATTTGGPGGNISSPSTIYFSEEGDPESWDSTDLLHLTPGDGERIMACVAWREFLFVFKQTKFFVFYGESVDANGGVIFDYRPVDTGVGLAAPKAYTVSENGVYFLAEGGRGHGIYLTNGGEPVEISEPIEPILTGATAPYYLGGTLHHDLIADADMTVLDNLVLFAFSQGGAYNDRVLVYDTLDEWWTLWDLPAAALATFEISDHPELVFSFATGNNEIARMNSSETSDNGTAITSRWRSGWFDLGSTSNKRVREWKVWGSGQVSTALSVDYSQDVGNATVLDLTDPTGSQWGGTTWGGGTWATPDVLIPRLARTARRGTRFSLSFRNSTLNQSWAVHHADFHIAGERHPSVRRTDKVAA